MFQQYHYLNGSLGAGVRCYTAVNQGKPVAFIAVACVRMKAKYYRVSRLVVLPDYQGIGVGKRLLTFIAELYFSNKDALLHTNKQSPNHKRRHEELGNNSFWTCKQGEGEYANKQRNQK